MKVLLTGATGFIGRALVPVLRRDGHEVLVWTRSPKSARARLGAEIETVDAGAGLAALTAAVEGADAVINLAGAPIVGRRWTRARRRELEESRIGVTEQLVGAIAAARRRPRVLVSGSAVGYYGDRADEVLTEHSLPGRDFLATLCQRWEAAAQVADAHGVRVVHVRTGVVLGRDGGSLALMLPVFRAGVGGPLGSGRQYLPWIHLHDLVSIIMTALVDARLRGPVNATAPNPVTNAAFSRALGRALRRPALMRVPAFVVKALVGAAATTVLGSQRVIPAVLRERGFAFVFPTIDVALSDIVSGAPVSIRRVPRQDAMDASADVSYLRRWPPAYELRTTTVLDVPLEEAFAFFSKAENLGMLTPAAMRFSIDGSVPEIGEGTMLDYKLRVGPVPVSWRSRIVNWRSGVQFADSQERGPYRSWYHEHLFRREGTSTVMEDCVYYAPPFTLFGRLANRLFIVPALRRIFQYRAEVIRLRFGGVRAGG